MLIALSPAGAHDRLCLIQLGLAQQAVVLAPLLWHYQMGKGEQSIKFDLLYKSQGSYQVKRVNESWVLYGVVRSRYGFSIRTLVMVMPGRQSFIGLSNEVDKTVFASYYISSSYRTSSFQSDPLLPIPSHS